MKRDQHCAHLRPDYSRLEEAHHIKRHPVTDEISWPPTEIRAQLIKLCLVRDTDPDT